MGKYKHGIPNKEIELPELKRALTKNKLSVVYKAYVILLYWLGCRRSEPMFVLKEDLEEEEGSLYLTIPALKGGRRGGPIELPLTLYGMPLIKGVWEHAQEGERLFPFCDKTGYRIIKKLFPKKTPHWLRHNRLTKLRKKRDRGKITTDNIKSFTGIRRDSTIERYGMKTEKGIRKVAQVLE